MKLSILSIFTERKWTVLMNMFLSYKGKNERPFL